MTVLNEFNSHNLRHDITMAAVQCTDVVLLAGMGGIKLKPQTGRIHSIRQNMHFVKDTYTCTVHEVVGQSNGELAAHD